MAALLLILLAFQIPTDALGWKRIGVEHARQNEFSEAERAFQKACELDPRLLDACYYHGRVLYALNRFEASLSVLQAALQTDASWKVLLAIGQTQEALGHGAAEESLRKALAAAKDVDPSPASALGLFLVRSGRGEEAIPLLRAALAKFPQHAESMVQLGRALLERGEVSLAITQLEQAVKLAPASAQAHLLLAKAYVRAGRAEEAETHFQKAKAFEAAAQGIRL